MSYSTLETAAVIGAGAMFVVTVLLFVLLNIPAVMAYLTGKEKKRNLEAGIPARAAEPPSRAISPMGGTTADIKKTASITPIVTPQRKQPETEVTQQLADTSPSAPTYDRGTTLLGNTPVDFRVDYHLRLIGTEEQIG